MRLLIIALSLFICSNCYAELWRYTDKATGEERGFCYSKDPIQNPEWNSEIITEDQKQHYIDLKNQQDKNKKEAAENEKDRKKKKAVTKLKSLGLDKDEIQAILGDSYE